MNVPTLARAPLAALAFLTRIPVGRSVELGVADVTRGAMLFPLVGGAVGAASGLVADVVAGLTSPLVGGALAVGVAALLTGAMHLDALADTADALGGHTGEHALQIMRDHAVGAFGATALIVVCLADASAFGALGETDRALLVGLAAGAGGRAAMLPLAVLLPYARSGDGKGRALAGMGPLALTVGLLIGVALAVPAGSPAITGLAAGACVAAVLGVFFRVWLGGVTGDGLGATAKLAETAILVTALAAT